jgi:hypothetical protein
LPVIAFHDPEVPVGVQGFARGQVVQQERVLVEQEPELTVWRHLGAGQPARLGERRPVVAADRVRLDDDVVVTGFGVERQPGLELRRLRRGHAAEVDLAGQAHV